MEDVLVLARWARKHSEFYQKLYQGKRLRGVRDLPVVEKDDLVERGILDREIFTSSLAGVTGLHSGGTSGRPVLSYYTEGELREVIHDLGVAYSRAGLHSKDRVANLFVTGYLYASFLLVHGALVELRVVNYPLSHLVPVDEVARFLESLEVTAVVGISSHVKLVLDHLATDPNGYRGLRKVFYAGEVFTEPDRRRYVDLLGLEFLRSGGYGAVDAGLMAYQCPYQTGGAHHPFATFHLEVVDPETLSPCREGEVGDVLITDLRRRFMPLIRYRIGDRGSLRSYACGCGRKDQTVCILGRSNDYVQGRFRKVFYDEVEAALDGQVDALQLVQRGDRVILRVEVMGGKARARETRDWCRERLAHLPLRLFRLDVLSNGGLPRHPKTGKLQRVVREA